MDASGFGEPETQGAEQTDLHDPGRRRQVEGAVRNLSGVLAARIVPGFDRPVDELHIVATPDRNPKQLVRDVQSLLFARFGVGIDHRVCSIVQFDAPPEGYGPGGRVEITHVSASQQGLELHASVHLSDGEGIYEGASTAPASAAGRQRAIARAALEAARPLLLAGEAVDVEGVTVTPLLGHEVAVTLVHFYGPRGARTVSGTALVAGDENMSVARSVLDALNRQIRPADDSA
jgi:hypothetical protein